MSEWLFSWQGPTWVVTHPWELLTRILGESAAIHYQQQTSSENPEADEIPGRPKNQFSIVPSSSYPVQFFGIWLPLNEFQPFLFIDIPSAVSSTLGFEFHKLIFESSFKEDKSE